MNDLDLRLAELVRASKQLERLGYADERLLAARRQARAAIALCAPPDTTAPRLCDHANALEVAQWRAKMARHATKERQPILLTRATLGAAVALRDAIRNTLKRIDSKRKPT